VRHGERLDDVAALVEFGEEGALDDVPVAVEPRLDQLRAADRAQLGDVVRIGLEQLRVVGELRLDEDAGQAGGGDR
jgi:hypothetical protein